jgi:hypothetical protein
MRQGSFKSITTYRERFEKGICNISKAAEVVWIMQGTPNLRCNI